MTKLNFYGETLTKTKVVNNIIKTFNEANKQGIDGLSWYYDAHDFAKFLSMQHIDRNFYNCLEHGANVSSNKYNLLTKYHVAGIIAALSPMQKWQKNKELTELFIDYLEHGKDFSLFPYMKAQIAKAQRIAQLENKSDLDSLANEIKAILSGEKTKAFFENIAFPDKAQTVTIDRHALSIALGKKLNKEQLNSHLMSKRAYEFFVECYKLAANKLNVQPLAIQAQTWELWRAYGQEFQFKLNNLLKLVD